MTAPGGPAMSPPRGPPMPDSTVSSCVPCPLAREGPLAIVPSAIANATTCLGLLDRGLEDDIDAGFEMCRELRAISSLLPIVFLTCDSDYDAIAGPRFGAGVLDDGPAGTANPGP